MVTIEKIDEAIHRYYKQTHSVVSPDLIKAILYSVDGGGKRIRPRILLEILEGFGVELIDGHYDVAAALEMIHTGSLIHDDLPAMDNDDFRRGRLTNHKKFDEATAVLAGDSLFLDPFDLVVKAGFKADVTVRLIELLSMSAGSFGMVGGQMLDMKGENKVLSIDDLSLIHINKTVRDDILDVTASFEELGKTPNKDIVAEKTTYPNLLGLDKSQEILDDTLKKAQAIFQNLEKKANFNARKIIDIIEGLRLNG